MLTRHHLRFAGMMVKQKKIQQPEQKKKVHTHGPSTQGYICVASNTEPRTTNPFRANTTCIVDSAPEKDAELEETEEGHLPFVCPDRVYVPGDTELEIVAQNK